MARFSATDQAVLFGSTTLTGVTSVEYPTISADAFLTEAAGDGSKKTVTGLKTYSVRVNLLVEDTDSTLMNALLPKLTGTWAHYPAVNTSGKIKFTSTKATVISSPPAFPTNGLAAMTIDFNLDDYTIALVS